MTFLNQLRGASIALRTFLDKLKNEVAERNAEFDSVTGAEFCGYIQDITTAIGGKRYKDRITGGTFVPANLADGVTREGVWAGANGDWEEFCLKNKNIKKSNTNAFVVSNINGVDTFRVDTVNNELIFFNAFRTKCVFVNEIANTAFENIGVTLESFLSEINIGFYNSTTGSQGAAKFLWTPGVGLIQLSKVDNTSLGVQFQYVGNQLQAKVVSGSINIILKIDSMG